MLAGSARPPIIVHTFHGHVLRGYFNPVVTLGFRTLERWLASFTTALVAVSPEVRDDLVRLAAAGLERLQPGCSATWLQLYACRALSSER